MGEWSELPGDLLDAIGKRLMYVDFIRFCAVCHHWRSSITKRPKLPVGPIPWLMIPSEESLYSLVEDKVYPLDLPEARGKQYRGSSDGWLVTVEEGPSLKLLNPLTRVQFDLPPVSTLPDIAEYLPQRVGQEYTVVHPLQTRDTPRLDFYSQKKILEFFLSKVILSPDHLSANSSGGNEYTAVAICGMYNRLAFCKHGDTRWTASSPFEAMCAFHDAIFHQSKFYAVCCFGALASSDIHSLPKLHYIVPQQMFYVGDLMYLVGTSNGDLMMIGRFLHLSYLDERHYRYTTTKFNVYRLNKTQKVWSEVKSLDDHIIFLGYCSTSLLPSRNFPELKSNCIYFTDNHLDGHIPGRIGGFDVGVFSLQDLSIQRLPGFTGDNILIWPPPTWVVPRLR